MIDIAYAIRGAFSSLANEWAKTKAEIKRWVCKADWDKHGKSAGPIRNARMLGWKPDVVVAFPGDVGTRDCVSKAKAAGIPVREVP